MKDREQTLQTERSGFGFFDSIGKVANRIFDILIISILHVIVCLPIVTLGGAKTALCKVCRTWTDGEDATVRDYLRELKAEWKHGIVPGLLAALAAALLIVDVLICNGEGCPAILKVLTIGTVLIVSEIVEQMFLVNAVFEVSVGQMVKDACILSLLHPFRSLIAAVLSVVIWIPALKVYLIALVHRPTYRELRSQFQEAS